MTRQTRRLPLMSSAPGGSRHLLLHEFGPPEARPKAYIQAALHADEIPGLLVQHHLLRRLEAAAAEGRMNGRIVVVPYANPIGLDQSVNRHHVGRYDLAGGGNFNRNWPNLTDIAAERLEDRLGADGDANVAAIRAALAQVLDETEPLRELDSLRLALLKQAVDADLVLDLHCDDDAVMHVYMVPEHWPQGADLATELGCRAVLLAEDSGGGPFDETLSTPWTRLAQRFPERPIPLACFSATVELRGQADVSDDLAEADAAALYRVLQRRGLIEGDPGPLPEPLCQPTRLDACDTVRSPATGVLSYRVALGAEVRRGEVIADLIDPAAEDPASGRREIVSGTDGFILSRRAHKYVAPGTTIAKVVGTEPLSHRRVGALLED